MQIVLSGNRVISYGDNCFLAMGGTVICEETGKAYSNATIAEVEAIPADIDSVGYEYRAGIFVPVAPYGKTKDGYLMAACFECGTPRSTDISISDVRDRLNTYATILVSYPEGSECTCEKDGVILTASDTSGSHAFNVPSAGVWTIKITDSIDAAEKTVAITKRWQYETVYMTFFSATINATYPAGSVCTCTDGVTTLTAPNTNGQYAFIVSNAGTWTLHSSFGAYELVENVTLTTSGQVETVSMKLWLYKNGDERSSITGGWVVDKNSNGTVTKETTQIVADGYGVNGNVDKYMSVYAANKINLTGCQKLIINSGWLPVQSPTTHTFPYFGVFSSTPNTTSPATVATISSNAATEIDVSALDGSYYIGYTCKFYASETYKVKAVMQEVRAE